MQINIAFGVTQNWLQYSAVTAASILLKSRECDEYKFFIMCSKFTEDDKNQFLKLSKIKNAEFVFIEMDDSYFEGAIHDPNGVSASYRLRLPSLTNEDKMLYLDSDIVAFQDVAELYSTDITNYYFAACPDKYSNMMKDRCKLNPKQNFYNSGMLLLNLKRFREENLEEKMLEVLRKYDYYTDQDVLNDVCRDAILPLHIKYNIVPLPAYKNHKEQYDEAYESPVLVHFCAKPWQIIDQPFADQWYSVKNKIKTF